MRTSAVVVESVAAAVASVLVESSVDAEAVVAVDDEALGVDGVGSWEDNWDVVVVVEGNADMEVLEVQDKQHFAKKDGMLWEPARYDRAFAAASDGGKDRQAPYEALREVA